MEHYDRSKHMGAQALILLFALVVSWFLIATSASMISAGWPRLILLPLLLLAFHYRDRLGERGRAALAGMALATIGFYTAGAIAVMRANIADPPEWDFQLFWIFGRVAVRGLKFYQPENLHQMLDSLRPSAEFLRELFFFHPPPTMLLFLPLGWFDIHTAFLIWYCFNCAILAVDVILLWRIFQRQAGLLGLLLTTALVLMLPATLWTISYGQTNFIFLLMILLFWMERDHPRGGLWLAIGIFAKPLLVFLPIYPLLRRHWRVLGGMIVALAGISLLSMIVFGPSTFINYFTGNPIVNSMPASLYTESVNQSLLANVLRLTGYDFSRTSPYTQPLFIILALLLTASTGWLVYWIEQPQADWALALTLVLALLIFPKTLAHYSVLLLVPICLIWSQRHQLPGHVWSAIAFITFEYALINHGGSAIFIAIALCWAMLLGVAVSISIRRPIHAATAANQLC
ncbi:MAG: glycosyltransferase family 87 protein [Roseiflexaceae bacterium]